MLAASAKTGIGISSSVPMDPDIIRELADCETPEQEYWTHVSAQDELPIAGVVEVTEHLARIDALVHEASVSSDPRHTEASVAAALLADPDVFDEARVLVSVKNKRAYLDLSYLFSRTSDPADSGQTLCGCLPHKLRAHQLATLKSILRSSSSVRAEKAAAVMADYLVNKKGLGQMLDIYAELSASQRAALMTHLVVPGEMQQREAKRRGHGAEGALAAIVARLGCTIVPADKATRPMASRDPNVDLLTFEVTPREEGTTASFDLIVSDDDTAVRVCMQSLIQSSDPGQFGVEKARTTTTVRGAVDAFNSTVPHERRVQLWGLIDGVGYAENKAGTLNPMLEQVHCSIQLKTLYKAALELHRLGLCELERVRFDSAFYSERTFEAMSRYVPAGVAVDLGSQSPAGGVRAGEAWIVQLNP